MRLAIWLPAVLACACVRSQLIPCGELACAEGAVCVETRCATPDQLAACTGLAESAACTLASGTVGRCVGAICTPSGCGNAVIDPGEVCDDGNATSGDGCSGTCDSDESCGNGLLDVVNDESCDCGGDEARRPASCTTPNSLDPGDVCTPDCKLRRCGDGLLGAAEQCDGAGAVTASCADFGYYAGAVSCSPVCQFDPSTCAGRCGDGLVDPVHEACDGAPPVGETCLGFGFDLGAIGCSSVCTPGLTGCDRLGWERAHPRLERAVEAWAGNGRLAVRFMSGTVALLVNGVPNDPAGTFTALAGSPANIYAVGAATVARYANGAWGTLPTPPWSTSPVTAWASDAELFVAVPSSNVVFRWNGTAWSSEPLPAAAIVTTPRFGGSRTTPYLISRNTPDFFRWNATAFVKLVNLAPTPVGQPQPNVEDVADAGPNLYIATSSALYRTNLLSMSGWSGTSHVANRLVSTTAGGIDALTTDGDLVRLAVGGLVVETPPGTIALAEDGGRSYAIGLPAGVFALRKGAWQQLADPDPVGNAYTRVRSFSGGVSLLVSGPYTAQTNDGRVWAKLATSGGARDVLAPPSTDPIETISAVTRALVIQLRDGGGAVAPLVRVDPSVLWRDPSSEVVIAVGGRGAAVLDYPSPITEFEMGATVRLDDVDGGGARVFAVGRTGTVGLVRTFDGTQWITEDMSPIVPVPLTSVAVASDGVTVYAVGGSMFYRRTAAGWTERQIDGANLLSVAVSGNDPNDVFVVGTASFGFPFRGLARFDGQNLYPVRLPSDGIVHDVLVEAGRIVVLITDEASTIDRVWSLARSTVW